VAPPKRKTGGRVTPSTRVTPGGGRVDLRTGRSPKAAVTKAGVKATKEHAVTDDASGKPGVGASRRYTPKVDQHLLESPTWVPILMTVLFVIGALAIMSRYLIWTGSNIPMLIGLACFLGGLFTATKWR